MIYPKLYFYSVQAIDKYLYIRPVETYFMAKKYPLPSLPGRG
nr:MAG TPA: hypothetical protein [Caudoviricetes sp.]